MKNEPLKYDQGKLRWDLLPFRELDQVADIYTFGSIKYEANSWQNVEKERYHAALLRHISKYMQGEVLDEESQKHHLAHAAWNCLALLYNYNEGK